MTTFAGDSWKISRGAMTISHEKKNGTLYMTSDGFGLVIVAKSKEDSNLWHQRLGHISGKGLKVM